MNQIGLSLQTLYADLQQRCLDAAFDRDFPANGAFYRQKRTYADDVREYWYYCDYGGQGVRVTKYVGPVGDPDIDDRVERFGRIKSDFKERRATVRALIAGGLPKPDLLSGNVLEALANAGVFRLRACLVGSIAFQTFSGLLGIRLPARQLQTSDADVAQFLAISVEVADSTPPMLEVLRSVDPTFEPLTAFVDATKAVAYRNASGYRVEFLVPNRSSDNYTSQPPIMPALGGTAAQPLRFLDFLIWNPMRATLLHNAGVSVNVPMPERYAIHKLIVATRRRADSDNNAAKIVKDIAQAAILIEAMAQIHCHDLTEAWAEAWRRDASWRAALKKGCDMLPPSTHAALTDAIVRSCRTSKDDPASIGLPF